MAARIQPRHIDAVRDKIKASQLVNALQNRALGKNKMDAVAVQAARVLLSKIVPDLKAVEHSGEVTQNVNSTLYVPKKDG